MKALNPVLPATFKSTDKDNPVEQTKTGASLKETMLVEALPKTGAMAVADFRAKMSKFEANRISALISNGIKKKQIKRSEFEGSVYLRLKENSLPEGHKEFGYKMLKRGNGGYKAVRKSNGHALEPQDTSGTGLLLAISVGGVATGITMADARKLYEVLKELFDK